MAFNPDDTFSEFLEFCKPYLEQQKSTELIKLLQKRFSDCQEKFKNSSDFADLTEITCAKIESDSKNIFIHLRDFLAELKSKQIDKKRKREATLHDEFDAPSPKSSKGETSDVDSDGGWNMFIRKTATDCKKDGSEYLELNKTKEVISNQEEQMCITIDDSDEEDTESSAVNLTVKKLQNSSSKQPDKSSVQKIDMKVQNHAKNNSHTNKLKLVQSTSKTQAIITSTTNSCNSGLIQKLHNTIDSCYSPAQSQKQQKLVTNTQLTESDKSVNKCSNKKPLNDIETIVLDDDDEDEDKMEDRNEIQNIKRTDNNLTSVNHEKTIRNKESSPPNTKVKKVCKTIDTVNKAQDPVTTEPIRIQIIEKETEVKQLTDKETNHIVEEVKGPEQKTDACTQQKIQSSPKVETSEEAKSECKTAELINDNDESQISEDCQVVISNHVDKAQKETSVRVTELNVQKASGTKKSDIPEDKPISSLIERNENSESENQEAKKEENGTGISEIPNDQQVAKEICNDEHAAKETPNDQHAAKENDNVENVEAGNGSVANVDKQDEQKAEKTKTGSKKQIARLEKLLEDLRNKIEGLKEKEVTLDEMDDECSSYILEDKYQQKFVKVWKKICELKNKSAATGRPIERRFKYSGTRYPEINRKLEKFVNKRKEFPDYHDVKAVITKVNQDKKIGLGTTAIERLAREAFLDVGESLQKRRRQDLAYTSAGHVKAVDKLTEDPASNDPELKKKLNENRKHYKEKMEQVMKKYSDIATATEPDEEENQSEEEDEEEETSQNIDVPEITTILEDRGSPVLEILEEVSPITCRSQDRDTDHSDIEMETGSFIIETDNAEEFSTGTDYSSITEEKTSGDEDATGSPAVLWEIDEDSISKVEIPDKSVCYVDLGSPVQIHSASVENISIHQNSEIISERQSHNSNDEDEEECPILYTAVKIDDFEKEASLKNDDNSAKSKVKTLSVDLTKSKSRVRILTGDDDLFEMSGVEEMSDSDEDNSNCCNEISGIIDRIGSPVKDNSDLHENELHKQKENLKQKSSSSSDPNKFEKDCSVCNIPEDKGDKLTLIDKLCLCVRSEQVKNKVKNLIHFPQSDKEKNMEKESIAKDNHYISDQSVKPISDSLKNLKDKNLLISKSADRKVLSLKISRNKAENILHDSMEQGKNDNGKGNCYNSKDLSSNDLDGNSEAVAEVKVTKSMGVLKTPLVDVPSRSLDSVRDSGGIIELDSVKDSEGNSELDSFRDSEGIIELSLGGSLESIESIQETLEVDEETEILTKPCDSENHNSLSKTSPFFKIVGVTSIDLDEYNTDSSDNVIGNTDSSNNPAGNTSNSKHSVFETDTPENPVRTKTKVVEYAKPPSEKSKSSNKITSLFGKVDKITNFLSGRVEQNSKQTCSSSKQTDSIPQHAQNMVSKKITGAQSIDLDKSKLKATESDNAGSSVSDFKASDNKKKESKIFNKEKWNKDFVKKSFSKLKGKLSLEKTNITNSESSDGKLSLGKKNITDSESSDEGDDIQIIQEENMDRASKNEEEIIVLSDSD